MSYKTTSLDFASVFDCMGYPFVGVERAESGRSHFIFDITANEVFDIKNKFFSGELELPAMKLLQSYHILKKKMYGQWDYSRDTNQ